MKKKKCNNSECGEIKILTEFHIDKRKTDGRRGQCKKCVNKKTSERAGRKRAAVKPLKKRPEKKKIVKIPDNKCECARGGIILKKSCILDCNDICLTCDSRQEGNVRAINIVSQEEDRNYSGSFGNSGALAAAEGVYNN
jgi:hypothetical protein